MTDYDVTDNDDEPELDDEGDEEELLFDDPEDEE